MGTTSIADALFTKVQQRVLAVLFGKPGRSYYLQEIVARAGSGTGAVQRELARLESAGLVTVTPIGRQRHYQANAAAPVFEELRGLVLKTSGVADVLREALTSLTPRIRAAFVFGSVARKTDTASSDVDLFVVSDDLAHADVYETLTRAEERLGRDVNPTIYTPDELARHVRDDHGFVRTVREGRKIWLFGDADVFPT